MPKAYNANVNKVLITSTNIKCKRYDDKKRSKKGKRKEFDNWTCKIALLITYFKYKVFNFYKEHSTCVLDFLL